MKIEIGSIIIDYNGNPVVDENGPLTIRKLLRMYAGMYVPDRNPKAAEESVIANAVALKIHNAETEVDLTEEEYSILNKSISTPRHGSLVFSQIYASVTNPVEKVGGE